ncbi:hypothetical protein PHYSODRAFT_328138 [Phytophthora sojae]|uniref:Uncharacterized protein n=1 Tax=Phytophthora sojae (strain P6497) TaxID=1094619 RepID=G4Z1W8_PHYSP|nr:hypothetical protein PHYSODRAFT_328138 [Phytophthora sojae]EGZ19966.1 hypothetical protein PHYSODRAFT_328138 [Phytophthora sojae]|eukprot:XP_009522683.1 hypothetical protein PHYSODRAFT_328138 [Phytophthora sojae]
MKFLFSALATAVSLLAAEAADLSNCVAVNFTERAADFTSLNAVLDLAVSSNLLSSFIDDPLVIEETNVAAESFSLLGMDFTYTTDIKDLNITGTTTVVPRHINVTSHDSLQLGADFSGNLQICWTDILHPATCSPAVIAVDMTLGLDLLTLGLNGTFDMLGCAAGLDLLLSRLLTRFVDASIQDIAVGFDSITALDVAFKDESVLISQLTSALLDFSADEINKKGATYKVVVEIVDKVAAAILNKVIEDKLKPKFGATCLGTR